MILLLALPSFHPSPVSAVHVLRFLAVVFRVLWLIGFAFGQGESELGRRCCRLRANSTDDVFPVWSARCSNSWLPPGLATQQ